MLLVPLAGQYEQVINARYVEKLGLGVWSKQVDESTVSRFLDRIAEPMPRDGRILWPDNEKFLETLQGVLSRLDTPVRIRI
jgi:UDP-N-acetylglucosamine:LPS N-acetylglucosamine transferase